MLIADTNEFHPLVNGKAYAAGHAPDGSPYQVVILRATYNNTHIDNAYASSLAQARAAGLVVGHYGYMTANVTASAQGAFFGQTIKANGGLKPGDTIWCDCEEGTGDQTARVQAFLTAAHQLLGDNPADEGVYSGAAFYAAHLGTTPQGLHRWIAAYGQTAPAAGQVLFQFTDNQAVPGVTGNCDCSIFNGTLAQFLATFGAAPAPVYPNGNGGKMLTNCVAIIIDPKGRGYWLVQADGGVFTHSHDPTNPLPFYGSLGGKTLNKPVVGGAATPDGGGYWLVAADGGVFTFGNAPFDGAGQ